VRVERDDTYSSLSHSLTEHSGDRRECPSNEEALIASDEHVHLSAALSSCYTR